MFAKNGFRFRQKNTFQACASPSGYRKKTLYRGIDYGCPAGVFCLADGEDDPHIWCRHYFLADTSQKTAIAEVLENAYGGDVHVHENTWPGLFGIISAMQMLMIIMYGLVIIFIMVVTVMTTAKILSAEQNDLGIYKAIGFGSGSLWFSFAISFGLTALIGSFIGMLLAAAFTDPLVSFVMKFAGISSFSSAPTVGNILLQLYTVVGLFTLFAYATSWKIKKLPLIVLISECFSYT